MSQPNNDMHTRLLYLLIHNAGNIKDQGLVITKLIVL
jgi:hypothetical protein